ncbi:hypothetical protein CALCODRAFT_89153 [Calocera cornea HHB12733]|uniref:F-box domain-containing protein n=1 Tax=Calocera cornea HHB12733 TaxID=1353952 RepID=A0A165DBN8_9BASI|nr:hypothetical protein CALCODRAFT_89153 [Calocera cornea HHB12733]
MLASPISPSATLARCLPPFGGLPSPLAPVAVAIPAADMTSQAAETGVSLAALPVELISRILETSLQAYHQNEVEQALARLLSVSHGLRNVALSTPSLWTDLRVTDSGVRESTLQHLQRSGVLPLDVTITVTCRNHRALPCKEGVAVLMESLASLRPSMSRWRTLEFNLPSCWLTQEALSTCGAALRNLEVLTVRTGHSDRGDYATPLPSVLVHMPRLRAINFHWYNFRWVEPACLAGVTRLRLANYYMDDPSLVPELLEMLRACPNLEHLELDTIAERWVPRLSHPPAFAPVDLPRLKSISFTDCGQEKAQVLLRDIRCPNVTSINLRLVGNINGILDVLTSQSHSWEQVTDFSIAICEFRAALLMGLLKRMPSLRKLEITNCSQMNKTLSELVALAETITAGQDDYVEATIVEGKQFSTLCLPFSQDNVQ